MLLFGIIALVRPLLQEGGQLARVVFGPQLLIEESGSVVLEPLQVI